jgi:hypothetical protein
MASDWHFQKRSVKARKKHYCEWCRTFAIKPGDTYWRHTEFPGGDAGYADSAGHPVSMRECQPCASAYQAIDERLTSEAVTPDEQ